MRISLFNGIDAKDTGVAANVLETTFEDLGTTICTSNWAPGVFKENRRQNKYLEEIALLVLDIDEGMTISDAQSLLTGYTYMIGTSRSHMLQKGNKPACERFRIVLPLNETITNDADFKATWFAAKKLLPTIDDACKDSARFFYSCREIVATNLGRNWTVRKAVVQNEFSPKSQAANTQSSNRLTPAKSTILFQINGAPDGEWHAALYKACIDLKQQRWTQSEAVEFLTVATRGAGLDAHDVQVIDDVYNNRAPKHPPRADGNEAMREIILRSHLIVNAEDVEITRVVELDSGRTHNIHQAVIRKILNKDEGDDFMKKRQIIAHYTYNPQRSGQLTCSDETGIHIFNEYVPPEWKREWFYRGADIKAQTIPQIYDDFFNHLTGGHVESKTFLLDWIATSIRARNYTILTAIGEQGIGKGVLGHILETMHGVSNYAKVRDDVFKNRFNSRLANKTLIYVDEADLRTKESQDRIKDTVNNTFEVEQKGKDARSCENYGSYYLSSNSYDAIRIEASDRRFSIIQLTDTPLKDTPLINIVDDLMDVKNVNELAAALWHHKVTSDMLRPFRSGRADEVMEAGLTDWEAYVVFDWCDLNAGHTIDIKTLQQDIVAACNLRCAPGRRKLAELAKKYPNVLKVCQPEYGESTRMVKVMGRTKKPNKFNVVDFKAK